MNDKVDPSGKKLWMTTRCAVDVQSIRTKNVLHLADKICDRVSILYWSSFRLTRAVSLVSLLRANSSERNDESIG